MYDYRQLTDLVLVLLSLKNNPRGYINDDNFDDFEGFIRKAIGHFFYFSLMAFWASGPLFILER